MQSNGSQLRIVLGTVIALVAIVGAVIISVVRSSPEQLNIVLPILLAFIAPIIVSLISMVAATHASESASLANATAARIETKIDNGAITSKVKEALIETGVADGTNSTTDQPGSVSRSANP